MSNVLVDANPGYYLDPLTVNVSFSPEVKEVSLNINGAPPSISKYISYDTLNPPNPFIAVTQDGNGNVIYDGGFPKFYNGSAETYPLDNRFRHAIKIKNIRDSTNLGPRMHISGESIVIKPGDKLVYDMFVDGNDGNYALKGYSGNLTNIHNDLHFVTDSLKDQNGIPLHYSNSGQAILDRSNGKWYTRIFDLSEFNDTTINGWVLINGNGPLGTSSVYIKDAKIVDINNQIKLTIINIDTIDNIKPNINSTGIEIVECREASGFDFLKPVTKYALNSIDFIADKNEVRKGNRKILFLGDQVVNGSYAVKSTAGSGFLTTFTRIAHHGYWDITIKDRSDYGANIDARLPELKQYAAVIFMSSVHGAHPYITQESVDAFVTYRSEGGGLFFITDHGVALGTIAQAQGYHSGFFRTANAVITRFGAWFSGDYNRIPVNVGFLRTNYGDHPLYKNLDDSENIPAGGSESRVFVTSDPLISPLEANKTFPIVSGSNSINLLVVLEDGSIEVYIFNYNIVDFKITYNANGQVVDNGGTIFMDTKDRVSLELGYVGSPTQVMSGKMFINGVEIGTVQKQANGQFTITYLSPFMASGIPINNNDFIYLKFTTPPGLEYGARVSRNKLPSIDLRDTDTWSVLNSKLNSIYKDKTDLQKINAIVKDSTVSGGKESYPLSTTLQTVREHLKGPFRVSPPTTVLRVASFMAPQHWYGFFLYNTGPAGAPAGIATPDSYLGSPIRDINSPVDNQMQLQMGTLNHVFTKMSVIYLDDVGPLFLMRDAGIDAGGVNRLWFGNGVVNIYKYFESKLGQDVEVRILG